MCVNNNWLVLHVEYLSCFNLGQLAGEDHVYYIYEVKTKRTNCNKVFVVYSVYVTC